MKRFENWGDELRYRVERIGKDGLGEDEKYAGGVYDMALDLTDKIYRAFLEANDLNDLGDTHFPDDKITDILYDGIKYGKGVE